MRPSDRVSALPLVCISKLQGFPAGSKGNRQEQDSTGGEGRDDCECALGTVTQAYFLNSAESSGTWASLGCCYSALSIFQEVRLRWNQWELEVTQVLPWPPGSS